MHAIDTYVPRFTTVFCGICIIVNLKLISEVLHVPKVNHLDYPSHERLSSISRDKLASLFCEKAMLWGGVDTAFCTLNDLGPCSTTMLEL